MKFVLASQNPHKLVEMQEILSAHGVEAVLQSEMGIHVDVEETGETFAANAMLKAKAVMESRIFSASWSKTGNIGTGAGRHSALQAVAGQHAGGREPDSPLYQLHRLHLPQRRYH